MRRRVALWVMILGLLAVLHPASSHSQGSITKTYFQCWAAVESRGIWYCTEIAWCTVYEATGGWSCDVYFL